MLFTTIIVFHVIVTVSLVLVVLLQSSKGDAMAGAAFGGGGGGGGASFGGMRSSPLSRATTVLAILFMVNCILLTALNADTSNNTGAPDPNARSAVTEQIQKELAAQQAAAALQNPSGDSLLAPVDLDSLVKVESGSSDSF